MLVNLSNHPSAKWEKNQRETAERLYGEITDMPFPEVDPAADESEIVRMAESLAEQIGAMEHTTVMVQGEFTLTYAIVRALSHRHISAVVACSRRETSERRDENGKLNRISAFTFVRFREYSAES